MVILITLTLKLELQLATTQSQLLVMVVIALNDVVNPVITFVKGFTYVFDVSDKSNNIC